MTIQNRCSLHLIIFFVGKMAAKSWREITPSAKSSNYEIGIIGKNKGGGLGQTVRGQIL